MASFHPISAAHPLLSIQPLAKTAAQVIEGSHLLGRVDHVLTGEQAGADKERVAAILERFPPFYVEMDPGDVLFFHSNLLHASAENTSDKPRWSMICCYNAARNNPYKESTSQVHASK